MHLSNQNDVCIIVKQAIDHQKKFFSMGSWVFKK